MPQVRVIQPISEQAKKLRVAAYARVSSDSADQLNSFATQVAYYTDFIQSKDEWEFAGLYADEAVSGTTVDKRDDFQRLLADCRAGKIDRILVKSISRFARNTLDCLQTVRELKQLGVAVEFEKEGIDTGNMGSEMLLSILGSAAQEESLSISKNLKWSYRRRMKSGDFITSKDSRKRHSINDALVVTASTLWLHYHCNHRVTVKPPIKKNNLGFGLFRSTKAPDFYYNFENHFSLSSDAFHVPGSAFYFAFWLAFIASIYFVNVAGRTKPACSAGLLF